MKHTISVLVENEFGVLARVAGLFSGRGFNIESLCVAETLDPEVSAMTIVSSGSDAILEQILKQLNKLVNVIKVTDFQGAEYVSREMVLVKINAGEKTREENPENGRDLQGPHRGRVDEILCGGDHG